MIMMMNVSMECVLSGKSNSAQGKSEKVKSTETNVTWESVSED